MNDVWFNPNIYGWIPGTILGVAGGLFGAFVGVFVPKRMFRKAIIAGMISIMCISAVLLVLGIVAYLSNQPRGVWYSLGLPGGLVICVFSPHFIKILKFYDHHQHPPANN